MLWTRNKKRRRLASATTLALWLVTWSTSVHADCPLIIEGEPPKRAAVLDKNCPAPFDGQLLEPELAISLAQGKEKAEQQLQLTLTATRAFWNEKLRYLGEAHELELEGERAKTQTALDRLEEVRPKWYERPGFVIPATLVASGFVALGFGVLLDATIHD